MWLFFITWNQLFADLCIIRSVLLTVTRDLLLEKEMFLVLSLLSQCAVCHDS